MIIIQTNVRLDSHLTYLEKLFLKTSQNGRKVGFGMIKERKRHPKMVEKEDLG